MIRTLYEGDTYDSLRQDRLRQDCLLSLSPISPPRSTPSSSSPSLIKLLGFTFFPRNLIFFIEIGLWLKTGPSIVGFAFGIFFGRVFFGFCNSLPFAWLCLETFSITFPDLPSSFPTRTFHHLTTAGPLPITDIGCLPRRHVF